MLVLEREGQKGNSLSFNPVNDDPRYLGYKALLYCITMPEKELQKNYQKIMAALKYGDYQNKKIKKANDRIIAKNIKTGKRKVFKNYADASEFTNISATTICLATKRGKIVKDEWRFTLRKAGEKSE